MPDKLLEKERCALRSCGKNVTGISGRFRDMSILRIRSKLDLFVKTRTAEKLASKK